MHMNEWTPLGQPGLSKFALRTWCTPLVLLLICCLFVVSAPAGANGTRSGQQCPECEFLVAGDHSARNQQASSGRLKRKGRGSQR